VLSTFLSRPLEGLDSVVRQVLRVAAYELLIGGTPAHAAVHEAVDAARQAGAANASGFVNGVLRAMVRAESLPEAVGASPEQALAIRLSHPDWIAERWIGRFGFEEARSLMTANNDPPLFGLRVNQGRMSAAELGTMLRGQDVSCRASEFLDDFLVVNRLQPVLQSGFLRNGACAVQDEAAALIVRLLDPSPGETVVDACAAPGGKSVYAASRMNGTGRLLAIDVHEKRLGLVRRSADAFDLGNVETLGGDFRDLARTLPSADRVLVDAPCTGLGVLRRRPELRWNRSASDLHRLVGLQRELLDAAAGVTRPGGILVYGTCTTEPEENERQVEAFLRDRPEFVLESAAALLPPGVVDDSGYYVSVPHRTGIDGAFAARMRRTG